MEWFHIVLISIPLIALGFFATVFFTQRNPVRTAIMESKVREHKAKSERYNRLINNVYEILGDAPSIGGRSGEHEIEEVRQRIEVVLLKISVHQSIEALMKTRE